MEIDDYEIECKHDHMYLIEVILDKYSKIDEWAEKEEEEEDLEEDEDEDTMKDPIQRKDPDDTRQIILTVKYFNTDEIMQVEDPSIYIETVQTRLLMQKLREEDRKAEKLAAEKAAAEPVKKKEEEEGNEEDIKIWKPKKLTADQVAGTMNPGTRFYSAKSRLFPMNPLRLIEKIKEAPLQVTFYWKADTQYPREIIGETEVQLGKNFIECVAKVNDVTPISTFSEDVYKLRNEEGKEAGFVKLFVRLTSYGKADYHIRDQGC